MEMLNNMKKLRPYMIIDLPDGTSTTGQIDYRQYPKLLNIDTIDLTGDRVLDIAANDGFWSFWAEKRGASVMAIDVDTAEGCDWGYNLPDFSKFPPLDRSDNFNELKEIFKSKVERRKLSIYDLVKTDVGIFDLVLIYGLVYHLRHPLLAIDRARNVCKSTMIVRTLIVNNDSNVPMSLFFEDDVFSGITNWSAPNMSGMLHWLKNAGFNYFFVEKKSFNKYAWLTFCACVSNDKYCRRFRESNNLIEIKEEYFANAKLEIQKSLELK
jgi:tRNA (mo5U34)-methyltransferase